MDTEKSKMICVVFDGPPGPESGRFVECEDTSGKSIKVGEWREREDGLWELRIPLANIENEMLKKALTRVREHLLEAHPYCTAEDQEMARVIDEALPETEPLEPGPHPGTPA